MIIKIMECEATYDGKKLCVDLAKYDTVLGWVEALINETANYMPLDCWIRIDENTMFTIRSSGDLFQEEANACLKKLRRISKQMQEIPRDKGSVEADMYERELLISLV